MGNNGWIKLHRKILDWGWYDDIPVRLLFMHLLIIANHKDMHYHGKLIARGSLITGRTKLAAEVGISEQETRTALFKLKSTNEITIVSTSRGTQVFINHYDDYQSSSENQPAEQPAFQPTINQPSTTNKKVRREEAKNNIISSASAESSDKFKDFLEEFNKQTKRKFKLLSDKARRQLAARLKDGYTVEDIIHAVQTAYADPFHVENHYKWLTPEFITRSDKLERYLGSYQAVVDAGGKIKTRLTADERLAQLGFKTL